jgi:hypothetical protein
MGVQDPVIIVSPTQNAWRAEVDGECVVFQGRYQALEWAHRWAQVQRPSLVRVLAADGAVEDEWAYGAFKGERRFDLPASGVLVR